MEKPRKTIWILFIAISLFFMGTFGFMIIEHWGFIDSAYMTAITLSTVGFMEVHQTSNAGRIFIIFLIFTGGGYYLYLVGIIIQAIIEGEIQQAFGRRRLDKKIKRLKNHYIVCGYGRIGKVLCQLIKDEAHDLVVIENDVNLVESFEKDNLHYILGDATSEDVLTKAGISSATALVAVLSTDIANVFLVLTARQLNPDIYIMARASNEPGVKNKLLVAGANRVESPYDIGATSMGLKLFRPSVSGFLDIALSRKSEAIQIEELLVLNRSKFTHVALKDSGIRKDFNLIIISIKKANGEMLFNPHFETFIDPGDTVIVMGKTTDLKRFGEAVNSEQE